MVIKKIVSSNNFLYSMFYLILILFSEL